MPRDVQAPTLVKSDELDGEERLDKSVNGLAKLIRDLKEGALAGLSKAKVAQVIGPLEAALRELSSNVPFVKKSFDEHVETRIEKAKVEIYGRMEQTVRRAGLAALAEKEGSPLLLEGPEEEGAR
jgi:hypothetical protein